jgi:ubiquinone/menaquinone biosynthesis C-methylase UbiE
VLASAKLLGEWERSSLLVDLLRKIPPLRRLVYRIGAGRAHDLVGRIGPYLRNDDRILDIGCGNGNITEVLRLQGREVVPVDVQDGSFVESVRPQVYDGTTLPFADREFDVGLLITVLHHTPDPERVLAEARRVCRRLVIVEDVYKNRLHKYFTFAMDSLVNLEFFGHPHTNKNDAAWRIAFDRLKLRVLDAKYQRSFLVFSHATYHLDGLEG